MQDGENTIAGDLIATGLAGGSSVQVEKQAVWLCTGDGESSSWLVNNIAVVHLARLSTNHSQILRYSYSINYTKCAFSNHCTFKEITLVQVCWLNKHWHIWWVLLEPAVWKDGRYKPIVYMTARLVQIIWICVIILLFNAGWSISRVDSGQWPWKWKSTKEYVCQIILQ